MAGRRETLETIKEIIKLKFNIQESGEVKKFIGVYFEWGNNAKVLHHKMTLEKEVNKMVYGCENLLGVT